MAPIVSLDQALAEVVHDGDSVALEGFTHLIPFAAAHELIRQRRRDLTLIRLTPDLVCDQLIGAGCVRKLVFSWGGNPGVGSLHRFRDAVEHGHPHPLEIDEHSHAGMANRYVAGASGLPFGVLRVIADPAERNIPAAALAGMRSDGEIDFLAVLASLANRPGQLPALLRLAADTRRAMAALLRCCDLLGPSLGFGDLD
jgi:acyl CoA:acetate/3-ketoacid CoA transferase alpha subunit